VWLDQSVAADGTAANGSSVTFGRYLSSADCDDWTNSTSGWSGNYLEGTAARYRSNACNAVRALACCNAAARATFAGYTTTTYNGGTNNGRPGMHEACDDEFNGSHMCHIAEYIRSIVAERPPGSGAWIDGSADEEGSSVSGAPPSAGRYLSSADCDDWTNSSSGWSGNYLEGTTARFRSNACNATRSIACCM